jgi:hypothetical protein
MAEDARKNAAPDVVCGDAVEVLRLIRAGALVFELNQELEKVVAGVRETGKGGEVRLKVVIAPMKQGSVALNVHGEVSAKIPKPAQDVSIFFPTDRNTLVCNDPRQKHMPFMEED